MALQFGVSNLKRKVTNEYLLVVRVPDGSLWPSWSTRPSVVSHVRVAITTVIIKRISWGFPSVLSRRLRGFHGFHSRLRLLLSKRKNGNECTVGSDQSSILVS